MQDLFTTEYIDASAIVEAIEEIIEADEATERQIAHLTHLVSFHVNWGAAIMDRIGAWRTGDSPEDRYWTVNEDVTLDSIRRQAPAIVSAAVQKRLIDQLDYEAKLRGEVR